MTGQESSSLFRVCRASACLPPPAFQAKFPSAPRSASDARLWNAHPPSPRGDSGALTPLHNKEVVTQVKLDHAEWTGRQSGALQNDSWCESRPNNILVRPTNGAHSCDSNLLRRLTDDLPLLPEVGDTFAGFQL